MKTRTPTRPWKLEPGDLPSKDVIHKASYFVELPDNAIFRLLTYRSTPFWRRGHFLLHLIIILIAVGLALLGEALYGVAFYCASGLIFYLAGVLRPDEAVLDELTAEDLEDLLATRMGVHDFALGIWGVRCSDRWIGARRKAGLIACVCGWGILLISFFFQTSLEVVFPSVLIWSYFSAQIVGMTLIAGGTSLRRRMRASPSHALPGLLRILDRQIKSLEARHQSIEYHAGQIFVELFRSVLTFLSMFVWFFALLFLSVIVGIFLEVAARGEFFIFLPADLQGMVLGVVAWFVGRTDGEWWRQFVEADIRKNHTELMEKVQFILRREQRELTHGELAQRFPRPEHLR